jgi:hypothetical protein
LVPVLRTGRPARIDDFTELHGTIADAGRKTGLRAVAAAPIIVDGEVWGAMTAVAGRAALPEHTEDRLAEFTELVATAISNTESRAGLARLADEQSALRRVATLVARGAPSEEVFAAVTEEVARLFLADVTNMCRYEPDGAFTILGSAGSLWPVGSRWPFGGNNVATLVFETARPARIENYAEATGGHIERAREVGIRRSGRRSSSRAACGASWPSGRAGRSRCRWLQAWAGCDRGHRGAAGLIHGSGGHGDCECREPRWARAPG